MSPANRPLPPAPTRAETNILRVLWTSGPRTVREVHEILAAADSGVGYTTVLKLLQIMQQKGLVNRDESNRAHVYEAVVTKASVQDHLTDELVDRLFEGSRSQLVMSALGNSDSVSADEIAQIRARLRELEKEVR